MITAPNLEKIDGLVHGFGQRDSDYPPHIKTVRQIHSSIVLDADSVAAAKEGDALVTGDAGTLVGIKTADCVPILLIAPVSRLVAAIHAGWRGTSENINARAVAELCVRGTTPRNLVAAVGPSIGGCCYEVGPEVARRFGKWLPEMEQVDGPVHLDLRRINEIQLRAAGVSDIWKSQECTFCTGEKFFSFRRERERAGRMISFAGFQLLP
jgi:YfiH family protein